MAWLIYPDEVKRRGAVKAPAGKAEKASEFARTRLGFEPDEQQRMVLDSTAKRAILNCSRQWGKSTVAAAKALHRAWGGPGRLVLVASPSERQSGESLRKVKTFALRLGVPLRGDGDNSLSLLVPNGSRIVGLPGKESTVRGFSAVSMLLIDEASRVPDEVYKALRPMLAVAGGDLWLMSTPCGRVGFFYEEWTHGGSRWERITVKGSDCGRLPREFLEEERAVMGKDWFGQEYQCEFVDNGSGWFERGVVEAALSDYLPLMIYAGVAADKR